MGRNKPVSQEILTLVFQLRHDGWNKRKIGMISPTDGVCLLRVNGNLNALGYEEILFDHLVPFWRSMDDPRLFINRITLQFTLRKE